MRIGSDRLPKRYIERTPATGRDGDIEDVRLAQTRSRIYRVLGISSAAYPSVTNSATLFYAGGTNPSNNTASRPTTIRK
jgi:hypothetical protein